LKFAQSLQCQHPDIVKVVWRFNRWHHKVDYSVFKNKLKRKEGLEVKEGKKFIKITKKNYGVHSFIVKEDFVSSKGVQFRKGDILKAAGYNMPAQNAARGNIFGDYIVRWTGALYMDSHGRLCN
jgi:hypothetical protein